MGSPNTGNLDSSAVIYTESGVSRVCVMEVEAVNSADVGLQVITSSDMACLCSNHHSAWPLSLPSPATLPRVHCRESHMQA